MQDRVLLKITEITDDELGIYQIGDLDLGITGYCYNFLEKPGNCEKFVKYLRWLANGAEKGISPFEREEKND
jgi:hypothetical protein